MKKLRTHIVGVDEGDMILFADFETNGPMWTGEGPREIRGAVTFSERFAEPPSVKIGLTMWDISNSANARADVSAVNVTVSGFEICFRTWGDTRIARVRVGWQAIGALPDEDLWEIV